MCEKVLDHLRLVSYGCRVQRCAISACAIDGSAVSEKRLYGPAVPQRSGFGYKFTDVWSFGEALNEDSLPETVWC